MRFFAVVKEFYQKRLAQLQQAVASQRKLDRTFSALRLVLALAVLGLGYWWSQGGEWVAMSLAGVTIVGFTISLKRHQAIRKQLSFMRRQVACNEDELQALADDYTAFDAGQEFIEPAHSYASDLDLFGRRSLFQRMNRTVTIRGKNLIATRLRTNDMEDVEVKQAAVKALADQPEWREAFRAHGKLLEEDAKLDQRLEGWTKGGPVKALLLKPAVLWSLTAVLPVTLVAILVLGELSQLNVLTWLGILNLIWLGLLLKPIRSEREQVGKLTKQLNAYASMIRLIEDLESQPARFEHIREKLGAKNASSSMKASAALRDLNGILDRLDSMDNLVAAVLLNALMLHHLHVFVQLQRWKQSHGADILRWLEALGEADALATLGTFAFNHPDFKHPRVGQGITFKAKDLGHPFLNATQRVNNSITFEGFQLVILTGSNMAGKSTFLRSLGVNILLAGLGLPVCASSLELSPVQLLSSMKPQDSLDGNESYFQAEVNRLRAMMDQLESGQLSFVLLDEILRGTNSKDKRNGTKAFLEKIKGYNLLGVIATHDVEIAELTAQSPNMYSNRFFESTLEHGELVFDYRLREGVCSTPNATDLMRAKGII